MDEKSRINLPEVFSAALPGKDRLYRLQRRGEIRKIAPNLYTSNMVDEVGAIVRRNKWQIVGLLYPDAIISERTAAGMKEGEPIFIISERSRAVEAGGIVIRPQKGAPPQPSDVRFMGSLYMASPARIILDNAGLSRSGRDGVPRKLSKVELEEYLDDLIKRYGEESINKLRDDMRALAPKLGLEAEFEAVNRMISALLRTHESKLESKTGIARSTGFPFDGNRVTLFAGLYDELEKNAPVIRAGKYSETLAFFEAYFSNFIEGTEFEVVEAREIVFKNIMPPNRPQDAHDIKGTFDIVSNGKEMGKTPRTFDDLIGLMQSRHKTLMGGRPDKEPGIFKIKANRAGSTDFVAPNLVLGTFKQGFEVYRKLTSPFSRAVFMMFLVAEVHPFNDGNGRIGRIMMNAELAAAGEQRIIIPTVYRNNYISALKVLSQSAKPSPIIRVLDFAQKYTAAVDWTDYDATFDCLTRTSAFMDPTEADNEGVRLMLPD